MASQRKIGALLGYANIIVKNAVNLIYTPLLLSFVGQADYGVYQTSNSFVFSLTLLTFGFSEAYVRFYMQKKANEGEDEIRSLNGMYLLLYIVVSSVALAIGLIFASNAGALFSRSFSPDQIGLAGELMVIMSFNVAATLFSTVFDAYIIAHEEFRFQQTRQMLTVLATPFLAFLLLKLGMGVVGVAAAQLAIVLVLLALNMRFAVVSLGMRFDCRHFDGLLFRSIAAFSAWIFANQICELANQSLPNIFLGAISGAAVVAVFSISIQIRSVFYSLSTTISSVFTPLINKIVAERDDNDALTNLMARVGRYQSMLYSWVLGGFALLGRFFISKWAGESYSDVYWLVLLMATPLFIPLTQNTGIEIQRAKNRHRARSVAYLFMAGLNVLLTICLAKPLGYWAPALGYVAYVILGCGVFMNWYYQRRIGLDMKLFWQRVLPPFVLASLVSAACLVGSAVVPVTSWVLFVVWGLLYSCIYLVVTYMLILETNERRALVSRGKSLLLFRRSGR